jgi:cephalosporin-C deacetylase
LITRNKMLTMKRICLITLIAFALPAFVLAQPVEQRVKIVVSPNHADWNYEMGENVKFNVTVLKYGVPCNNVSISYEIGPERMVPRQKAVIQLKNGQGSLQGGTMNTPGFLRCIVTVTDEGVKFRNLATAGFSVAAIKPTVSTPADFVNFWQAAKDTLAKIPLNTKMILLPERCTENVNVYEVNLQNYNRTRLYGIVCIPKAPGKYPAMLLVPGAGVRSYAGHTDIAEKGVITLEMDIHGIPITLEERLYESLRVGVLKDYPSYNLDDKDRYYYKRVYMGCIRANDFLCSLPQFDGVHLGVLGGSQGGALAIVTAALDKRITAAVSMYPALSDLTGYLFGRAGGWPHFLDKNNIAYNNTKEKLNTIPYYDVVNFAKMVTVPIKMSWGYNDEVCPPTTSYAVYNSITSVKSVDIVQDTGHWSYPEQAAKLWNWLLLQLKSKPKVAGNKYKTRNF